MIYESFKRQCFRFMLWPLQDGLVTNRRETTHDYMYTLINDDD